MDESQSGRQSAAHRAKGAAARAVRSAREGGGWAGWALVAAGAVLCVLGWYGVSGERFVEQQVPYLASATVPGAALIVAGAVLVALRPPGRAPSAPAPPPAGPPTATDRRIEHLYALLVDPADTEGGGDPGGPAGAAGIGAVGIGAVGIGAAGTGAAGPPLAVPGGTLYHRPECPLVAGKASAADADASAVRDRGLTPCRLCDPEPPDGDPDPDPGGATTRPGDPRPPTG
ncbi:hypothetical protein ACFVFS_00780 [Kitasatospora sp. NPDC057692]|uniref:hypothetical protein n=1 Tax=Kitasatospora sp. NPDC057692 TaxID=3346215 RepID=UPI0036777425